MFTLVKALQFFLWPLTWVLISLGVGVFFISLGRKVEAMVFTLVALVTLLVFSLPAVDYGLRYPLESTYPTLKIANYPLGEAAVVFGGTVAPAIPPRPEPEEIGGGRVYTAYRLWKLRKVYLIIVAAGNKYWNLDRGTTTESEDMKKILMDMGVPETAIVLEDQSRNTHENAMYTARILEERGLNRAFLVTCAFHMNRAMAEMEQYNIKGIPVPVCRGAVGGLSLGSFIPNASALAGVNVSIKEYVGGMFAGSGAGSH